MNLKPMSLNQKEQKQQDTTLNSNKSEAYVTPCNEDEGTPPILKISEYDRLVLCSYKEHFLKAGRTLMNGDDYISLEGNSNYSIFEIFKCWGAISKSDLEHMEEFNDVLILGALCKVLCKVELPAIQVITKYSNLFEQFVNETLEYYLCNSDCPYGKDYTFNVNRALKLVSERVYNDISGGDILANYILLKSVKDVGAVVLAAICVKKYHLHLEHNLGHPCALVVPLSIATSNLETILLDYLYDSLIWILLSKTGFCVNMRGRFYTLKEDISSNTIKHSAFYRHTVFSPFSVNSIFQNAIKF